MKIMSTRDLARFFVRFQALCFLFYAVFELTGFPRAYRSFKMVHEFRELDSAMAEEFWIVVARIGLQLGAAVFLFGWSEKLIDLLTKGVWPAHVDSRPESGDV